MLELFCPMHWNNNKKLKYIPLRSAYNGFPHYIKKFWKWPFFTFSRIFAPKSKFIIPHQFFSGYQYHFIFDFWYNARFYGKYEIQRLKHRPSFFCRVSVYAANSIYIKLVVLKSSFFEANQFCSLTSVVDLEILLLQFLLILTAELAVLLLLHALAVKAVDAVDNDLVELFLFTSCDGLFLT